MRFFFFDFLETEQVLFQFVGYFFLYLLFVGSGVESHNKPLSNCYTGVFFSASSLMKSARQAP
jgi:hypothetical protein